MTNNCFRRRARAPIYERHHMKASPRSLWNALVLTSAGALTAPEKGFAQIAIPSNISAGEATAPIVLSPTLAGAAASLCCVLSWVIYALGARNAFGQKLTRSQALSPLFMAQNAVGSADLGRLQFLTFTFLINWAVLYRTFNLGYMSEIYAETIVLLLLAAVEPVVSLLLGPLPQVKRNNQSLLIRTGVIPVLGGPYPAISDLFTCRGHPEIMRLQAVLVSIAVLFSYLCAAIKTDASVDLSGITLLFGASQCLLITSLFVPDLESRRVDSALDALRQAGAAVVSGTDVNALMQLRRARQHAVAALSGFGLPIRHANLIALVNPEDLCPEVSRGP